MSRTVLPLVYSRSQSLLCLACTGLLLLGMASDTFAEGWKVQLQGVKQLGFAYAGRALAEDASTIWFNPAGMTRLEGNWTVTAGASPIWFALDYTDGGSRSVLGQSLTGETRVDGGTPGFPFFVYVAHKLTERWRLGVGANFPYGLRDDYGETWVGRYHATKSDLRVLNLNPAVAYKVNDSLSIGLGLDVQQSSATLGNMLDFGSLGATLGLPVMPQGQDGSIELETSDWALGWDASVAWQITPQVRVASTYRSQIEHTLSGDATFVTPPSVIALTSTGAFVSTEATAVLPMPHEISGSVAYDINKQWVVVGDLTWTNWSRFEQLTVTFDNPAQPAIMQAANYANRFRGAGGVAYRVNERWTIRGGGLYEATPVPDSTRTPRLPEVNNAGFCVGGTLRMTPSWDFDFSWSHLIPHDAPLHLVDPAAGLLDGSVRWRTDAVGFGVSARF